MVKAYDVQLIAIGNGTASRETEQFVADLIKSISCQYNSSLSMKRAPQYTQHQKLLEMNFLIFKWKKEVQYQLDDAFKIH